MTKSIYATAEESASFMKPDTRTNAEKILYELQKEQTHDFEMGHDVDNGAIALKLIEQNLELLEALQSLVNQFLQRGVFTDPEHPDRIALALAESAIAKATGGAA